MTCASGSQITAISDVYATNCHPIACPAALTGCTGHMSCNVVLDNALCTDPCVGTPKSWSVAVTCN